MINRTEIDALVKLVAIELHDFPTLRDIGYIYTGIEIIPATKDLDQRYEVRFMQEERLVVGIRFSPMPADKELGWFSVFLRNLDEKGFYSTFAIDEWFEAHNRCLPSNAFKLSGYEGSTVEKIRGFKAYLSSLLSDPELQPVIRGAKWEEVPFDWASIGK